MVGLELIWRFGVADNDGVHSTADERKERRAHSVADNESDYERETEIGAIAQLHGCPDQHSEDTRHDTHSQADHEKDSVQHVV